MNKNKFRFPFLIIWGEICKNKFLCDTILYQNSFIPESLQFCFQKFKSSCKLEFPSWLSGLWTQHSVYVDADSIPGCGQWVKDLALLQAAV